MAASTTPITIPQLCPGKGKWRLDWLGQIRFADKTKISSQPSIEVFISAIPSENAQEISIFQRSCWVPIGISMHIKIGDIWENGLLVDSPSHADEAFSSLNIEHGQTSIIKAGNAVDTEHILPFESHPWHQGETGAYCNLVKIDANHQIVIPALELIRFYFGSSSTFLIKLFQPLNEIDLWELRDWDESTGHLHLILAKSIPGYSAADIGRIATSDIAMKSAKGIYHSIVKTGVNSDKAFAYTNFPIRGKTDLLVTGKWIPANSAGMKTFAVFQIRSCSHPFPFSHLRYQASSKSPWHKSNQDGNNGQPKNSSGFSKKTTLELDTMDPNKTKSSGLMKSYDKLKFPDLKRKPIWRDNLEEASSNGPIFLKKSDGTYELVATGKSFSAGQGRQVDMVQAFSPIQYDPSELPEFVKSAIDYFEQSGKQFLAFHPPEGVTSPHFPLPLVKDENDQIDPNVQHVPLVGKVRRRQACILEVSAADHSPEVWIVVEGLKSSSTEVYGKSWVELGFPFMLDS